MEPDLRTHTRPGAFDPDALARGGTRFVAAGNAVEARSGKLDVATIRVDIDRVFHDRSVIVPNLFGLGGKAFHGSDDAQSPPLSDDFYPDAASHRLIGESFVHVFSPSGPVSPAARVCPCEAPR